ncbi:MAG TPA: nucleotidyl transferase AbiEii/AbiGii toxin family protein [Anaerolineales bacterium]|nr:nucleotidyl transferase AbiEii/AbiGii toxin family protein [Anaerolineales bacterium]
MDNTEIQSVLQSLGERVPSAFALVLVGGSALALLGSPRPTIDIDFIGDDVKPSKLHQVIMKIGKELSIDVEPVPIERFIPLPAGSDKRRIYVGQFGNLNVYVADPYSIALSKVDRGFDTDIDDIIFLVEHNYVNLDELERITLRALAHALKFDFHPEILDHLQELKARLK